MRGSVVVKIKFLENDSRRTEKDRAQGTKVQDSLPGKKLEIVEKTKGGALKRTGVMTNRFKGLVLYPSPASEPLK